MIKRGVDPFQIGDKVTLFRRKGNGYPASIEDGVEYFVEYIENDNLLVRRHSTDGIGFLQPIKVHKTYMVKKCILRDIKINSILGETN